MAVAENLKSALRIAYFAVVAIAVVPKGAPTHFSLYLSACAISVVTLFAVLTPPRKAASRRLYNTCFALGLVLGGIVFLQSLGFADNPLAHPIWAEVEELLGEAEGAISVEPHTTRQAAITLLSPLLVLLAGLALFQTDDEALSLWRFLAIGGALFALYGVLRLHYFPDKILWYAKDYSNDSLSSVFVNRNTAGTFLGVASLLQVGWLVSVSRSRSRFLRFETLALSIMVALTLVALFLTKSRGAVLSTLAAYLFVAPMFFLMHTDPQRAAARLFQVSGTRWIAGRVLVALSCMVTVLVVFAVFAGRTIFRIEMQGTDDARFCVFPGIWRAFLDNWILGTGFGTFEAVFPMYRDPQCGIYGLWDRAHSFFLEGLVGLGIGFIPIILFIYLVLGRVLWKGYQSRRSKRYVSVVGVGVLVLLTLHSLVDFSLQVHGVAVYVAATFAAVLTLCLGRANQRRSNTRKKVTAKVPDHRSEGKIVQRTR